MYINDVNFGFLKGIQFELWEIKRDIKALFYLFYGGKTIDFIELILTKTFYS
ncbi:hypothetical protein [Flavobacterium sp. HSC-61S13]|uniref:hypothetical protein n=1 Tax=Flavobacterium sp. HSC-61S13 TaxID=2910963 RepID=UPI00209E4CE3|nr:hypothetical protein [Flavobacterium sp. HSC-61S13]MCP1997061.1 hypothetical protein [Flavobacterium sp. HSC-61S13]